MAEMGTIIRRADATDLPTVYSGELAYMHEIEPSHVQAWLRAIPLHLQQWTADLDRMVVAEREGDVVGYCFWMMVDASAVLASIFVAPAARRQGVGRALLRRFVNDAVSTGCTRLVLDVAPINPAKHLYEAEGFERAAADPNRSEVRYLRYELINGAAGSPAWTPGIRACERSADRTGLR